jgi:outer membrane receptor for ferrienterochelin and colicin
MVKSVPSILSRKLMLAFGLVLPLCAVNADVETIEEVVVTAELRAVAVSEVAGSVSLLIPDDRSDVVNHLEEVLAQAVNVNFASAPRERASCKCVGLASADNLLSRLILLWVC